MDKSYNTNKETGSKHEKAESREYEKYERKQSGYDKSGRSEHSKSCGKDWKGYKNCK